MIRKYYLAMLLISFTSVLAAQEDYMEVIADRSCECLAQKKTTKTNLSSQEIGTCLLLAARDYRTRILEDYNLDLNDLTGGSGERLGELIGSKMAFLCPELIVGAAGNEEENPALAATGTILDINNEIFAVFELENENGRVDKFYWLTYVDSNLNLQNEFHDLKGEQVQIEYVEQELFDSRIKEYRKFNVITTLRKD